MLLHCAHARFVWNLAVEQHTLQPGRTPAPAFAEQCRQLMMRRRGEVPCLAAPPTPLQGSAGVASRWTFRSQH
jgi:hypothetical protein